MRKTPEECYQAFNERMLYLFLHWQLNQKTGKRGRVKGVMKSSLSLRTFWCEFRVVFDRANGFNISRLITDTQAQIVSHLSIASPST